VSSWTQANCGHRVRPARRLGHGSGRLTKCGSVGPWGAATLPGADWGARSRGTGQGLVARAPAATVRAPARCNGVGATRHPAPVEQATDYAAMVIAVITLLAAICWTARLPAL
jgi:hypothetical protein